MNYQEITETYHLPVYNRYPITLVKGRGAYVWDEEGNKYFDALAGIAVNSLGHCHPKVVGAIREQAARLMHISNFYYSKPQAELLELLARISGMDRGFLCNSGAEAMEASLKVARKYGKAHGKQGPLLTVSHAFHGRTIATISMGMDKYAKGYDPLLTGFHEIPLNDVQALEASFNEETLGIVLETIQGSGGLHLASEAFISKARALCSEHNALFIVDEVQTGMGRTGRMFGYEHYGISPDIIAVAKAMGGGFPIGAMLCNEKAADVMSYGDHGSTYGGNPLACAASLAAITAILDEDLPEQAREKGAFLKDEIEKLTNDIPQVVDVRGRGLMIGVELSFPGRKVVEEMMRQGILSNCTQGNIMRLVPPIVASREDLGVLAEVLAASIKKMSGSDKTNG
jgi:acetylornithine/N-succinyldiaminopimelate aminotransferase